MPCGMGQRQGGATTSPCPAYIGYNMNKRIMILAKRSTPSVVATSLVLAALAAYGQHRFGSLPRAFAYVRGERFIIEPVVRSLGEVRGDAELSLTYTVTNLTDRRVKVLGAKPSCLCTIVSDLPPDLPSCRQQSIRVAVHTPEASGRFSGNVTIYTDDIVTRELRFVFVATVRRESQPPSRVSTRRDTALGPASSLR